MFTGLIQNIGKIAEIKKIGKSARIVVASESRIEKPVRGESIAVNGVCLTLEKSSRDGRMLEFFALEETLSRTNLGRLEPGSKVNVERALRLGDRFGGHIVSGHVDSIAKIIELRRKNADVVMKIETPSLIAKYIVQKGNVALDGISLTVVEVRPKYFSVHIIPETWTSTAVSSRKNGDLINVEADLLAKYVDKLLEHVFPAATSMRKIAKSGITMDRLAEAGW